MRVGEIPYVDEKSQHVMWIWRSAVACQARMKMMRMLVRCFIHVLDVKCGWSKEGLRSCAMQGPRIV